MADLDNYRMNVTSQNGEDGIIEELFGRLGLTNSFCIEFGAWDGKHLSNVWHLWHNHGWDALLIESDEQRAKALALSVAAFAKVNVQHALITPEGATSIGTIAKARGAPAQIDLLSIDVDGNDYYIFQHLTYLSPRVIIIEYNPTIPPHIAIVQKLDEYFGASALAITQLAHARACPESS